MSENTFFSNKKTWVLSPKFACEDILFVIQILGVTECIDLTK